MTDNQNETPTVTGDLGLSPRVRSEIELTFNSLTNSYATVGEYIAHYFPGEKVWPGDWCGCTDDRCTGHHHQGSECGCFDVQLDEFHDDLSVAYTIREWVLTRGDDQELAVNALGVLYTWSCDIADNEGFEVRLNAEQRGVLAELFASASHLDRSDYITAVNRVGIEALKPTKAS